MSSKESDGLYMISYLLKKSEDSKIVGYSNLAARVYYLHKEMKIDEEIPRTTVRQLENLVERTEEPILEWGELRSYIEGARMDEVGSMFIEVSSESRNPNEWKYKFESSAPEPILEQKIESLSEKEELVKQTIRNVAKASDEDIYEEVF